MQLRASVLTALLVALTGGVACAQAAAPGTGPGSPSPTGQRVGVSDTVVAITIDGLNPQALRKLGRGATPNIHQLIAEGASTLNARTALELTHTLPNHTSMVTGRRIAAANNGHGVTWNDNRLKPPTVQAASHSAIGSVFTALDDAGLSSGFFASKVKFSLWDRSWPVATDTQTIIKANDRLVQAFNADLTRRQRAFRLLHLSETDSVGHAKGFMSSAYLRAVRRADRRVGEVIETITEDPALFGHTTVILTADHGGKGRRAGGHGNPRVRANYTVPFVVWGAGVDPGTDLYDLNPDYADPGSGRPAYDGIQPVRNGAVANLALDLLGLPAVPGSEFDVRQDLDVSAG